MSCDLRRRWRAEMFLGEKCSNTPLNPCNHCMCVCVRANVCVWISAASHQLNREPTSRWMISRLRWTAEQVEKGWKENSIKMGRETIVNNNSVTTTHCFFFVKYKQRDSTGFIYMYIYTFKLASCFSLQSSSYEKQTMFFLPSFHLKRKKPQKIKIANEKKPPWTSFSLIQHKGVFSCDHTSRKPCHPRTHRGFHGMHFKKELVKTHMLSSLWFTQ